METVRKYDLLAICLLMFTVMLTGAMWADPKGFSIREWQPLMAAVLALGGAGIVFRGATLTYQAAMAKVDLDREIHAREQRRKSRGIFLRVQLDMHVLAEQGKAFYEMLKPRGVLDADVTISLTDLKLWSDDPLQEAWLNLDVFPAEIAREISRLRVALLNFNNALSRAPNTGIQIFGSISDAPIVRELREAAFHIMTISRNIAATTNSQAFALL